MGLVLGYIGLAIGWAAVLGFLGLGLVQFGYLVWKVFR